MFTKTPLPKHISCNTCGLTVIINFSEYFDKNKGNKANGGYDYKCKKCKASDHAKRYADDPDKFNRKRVAEAYKRKYGLTITDAERLWLTQDKKCCGCKQTIPKPPDRLLSVVDHDHDTGAVRGILCAGCNTALGMIKDNPDTLRNLAEYLEASNRKALTRLSTG